MKRANCESVASIITTRRESNLLSPSLSLSVSLTLLLPEIFLPASFLTWKREEASPFLVDTLILFSTCEEEPGKRVHHLIVRHHLIQPFPLSLFLTCIFSLFLTCIFPSYPPSSPLFLPDFCHSLPFFNFFPLFLTLSKKKEEERKREEEKIFLVIKSSHLSLPESFTFPIILSPSSSFLSILILFLHPHHR